MATAAANPVYALLGKKTFPDTTMPVKETLLDGDLAFRQHSGGHTDGPKLAVLFNLC